MNRPSTAGLVAHTDGLRAPRRRRWAPLPEHELEWRARLIVAVGRRA